MDYTDVINHYRMNENRAMGRFSTSEAVLLAEEAKACGIVRKYERGKKRTVEYYNCPAALDIETSNLQTDQGAKAATMYIWMVSVNGLTVYGRTWEELLQLFDALSELLQLSTVRRLVYYVHNLAFEFQFLRKWCAWSELFALEERKPVYAVTASGIELRCSYILTAQSLDKVGRDLITCPVRKLTGSLNYDAPRGSETPLTETELAYCKNDVLVVTSLIIDKLQQDGSIDRIPLTKTGYVRRHMRDLCLYDGNKNHRKGVNRSWENYRQKMAALILEPAEYMQCKRAFSGGFVHASAHWCGMVLEGVRSYDIASSYPTVMCCEMFPMSRARTIHLPEWEDVLHACARCCCLLDLEIWGLMAKDFTDHPLSASKCRLDGPYQEDNGRLVNADHLVTTCTDVDLDILMRCYTFERIECRLMRTYLRGYLPRKFIQGVLQLYADKTQLKGVEGAEVDYMLAKGNINSCYGMAVTDIVRPEVKYGPGGWYTSGADIQEQIDKYNQSKGRFLFYPWGVWVTAYARRNIFAAILEAGDDYVYSDTDSVKLLHADRHAGFFLRYNARVQRKLLRMCEAYGIDPALIRPKDRKGRQRPLGIFEDEGEYGHFKTLGAKRYLTETGGRLVLTCSGVNKAASEYIGSDGDIMAAFERFSDGLYIPADATGKLTHTYIDDPVSGEFRDVFGRLQKYDERSCVHLEGADYSLGLSQQYIDYLLQIRNELV